MIVACFIVKLKPVMKRPNFGLNSLQLSIILNLGFQSLKQVSINFKSKYQSWHRVHTRSPSDWPSKQKAKGPLDNVNDFSF